MMGSPPSEPRRGKDEGPQHEVTITRGFRLGKYEITQGQWESVMGTRPWSGKRYVQVSPDHPAVYISWEDVQSFIGRLNGVEGKFLYRLPTEAEWECAARAGTTGRWAFGDDEARLREHVWYRTNTWNEGLRYAFRVGTKSPNPWHLHDMHGNVWEWCLDWYGSGYYSGSPDVDPQGPPSGAHRVLRGGSFCDDAVGSAFRYHHVPSHRGYGVGARLVRTEREWPVDTR